jgi:exosortase H (IPTLxxWG-CTERM-specific)
MKRAASFGEIPNRPASRRKDMAHFLAIFLAVVAIYYCLTLSPWIDAKVLYPVLKASARGTSALLNLGGFKTTVEGVIIHGPAYSVAVRRGCDPVEPMVLFAAGVVAFPAPWRRRLQGIFAVAFFLFALNLVRIASLYLLGLKKSSLLDAFHLWYWPAFFIICSLLLWVLWIRWIQPPLPASSSTNTDRPGATPPSAPFRPRDA